MEVRGAETDLRVRPARFAGTRTEFGGYRHAEVVEPESHTPVMPAEVLAALAPREGGRYVDCTYGRGGHTRAVLPRLGPSGRILALDRDPDAISAASPLAEADSRLVVAHASFSSLERHYRAVFGASQADGVLFDLGVSSPQLEDPSRGFSFRHDGPLDMRMNPASDRSAADWLRDVSEAHLVDTLRSLGEEPFARRIARAIVKRRVSAPILRTRDLADLVTQVVGRARRGRSPRAPHPATATFRALRMVVNQELSELEQGLLQAARILSSGGRLVVISFHSLEDRLTKRFLREHGRGPRVPRALPIEDELLARAAFRRPGPVIRPSETEVARNPRARSACLRVGEMT